MEWTQVLTIVATLLGGVYYIHTDVREIRKDMQQQTERLDAQALRTDKLYEMFIDLLKHKNTP